MTSGSSILIDFNSMRLSEQSLSSASFLCSSSSFLFASCLFSMRASSFSSLTCCSTTGSSSEIAVTRFKVTPPSAESESSSSLSSMSLSLVSESSFTTNTLENRCELESSSRSLLSADDLPDELPESSREC
ncbi:hypothetical protein PUN28_014197 [Cardiocondyla obscurior]|uniref:Secreted protein n=1 Tax=Cardiocondyla obscurior TaxID=286306 RepID=A0AAW2F268_9HYME